MIRCGNDDRQHRWIAALPNCSASWRTNQLLLAALGIWLLAVGCVFAAAGLWLVLPFAGLELGLLGLALHRVGWKLRQRHVVRFGPDDIRIEKGVGVPEQVWNFQRRDVALSVDLHRHPEAPLALTLFTPSHRVPVGDFLNRDDSHTLLELLRGAGIAVRNHSPIGTFQP